MTLTLVDVSICLLYKLSIHSSALDLDILSNINCVGVCVGVCVCVCVLCVCGCEGVGVGGSVVGRCVGLGGGDVCVDG